MMKWLFVLLFAWGCCFSIVLYAKKPEKSVQKPFTEIVNQANHGVAAIVIPAGNNGLGIPIGSAFFVDEDYLVTNAHVILEAEKTSGQHWGDLLASLSGERQQNDRLSVFRRQCH